MFEEITDAFTAKAKYQRLHDAVADGIDEHAAYLKEENTFLRPTTSLVQYWPEAVDMVMESMPVDASLETTKTVYTILAEGVHEGARIDVDDVGLKANYAVRMPTSGMVNETTLREAYYRRLFFAQLVAHDADAFTDVRRSDITALHGTQAVSVPSILTSGALLSHKMQNEQGVLTGSGETFPAVHRRQFISFAALQRTVASKYAAEDLRSDSNRDILVLGAHTNDGYELRIDELVAFNTHIAEQIEQGNDYLKIADRDRFGVIFGLSRSAFWMNAVDPALGDTMSIHSDIEEIGIKDSVPLAYTPLLFTPEQYVDTVRQVLPDTMKVIPEQPLIDARTSATAVAQSLLAAWHKRR